MFVESGDHFYIRKVGCWNSEREDMPTHFFYIATGHYPFLHLINRTNIFRTNAWHDVQRRINEGNVLMIDVLFQPLVRWYNICFCSLKYLFQ